MYVVIYPIAKYTWLKKFLEGKGISVSYRLKKPVSWPKDAKINVLHYTGQTTSNNFRDKRRYFRKISSVVNQLKPDLVILHKTNFQHLSNFWPYAYIPLSSKSDLNKVISCYTNAADLVKLYFSYLGLTYDIKSIFSSARYARYSIKFPKFDSDRIKKFLEECHLEL